MTVRRAPKPFRRVREFFSKLSLSFHQRLLYAWGGGLAQFQGSRRRSGCDPCSAGAGGAERKQCGCDERSALLEGGPARADGDPQPAVRGSATPPHAPSDWTLSSPNTGWLGSLTGPVICVMSGKPVLMTPPHPPPPRHTTQMMRLYVLSLSLSPSEPPRPFLGSLIFIFSVFFLQLRTKRISGRAPPLFTFALRRARSSPPRRAGWTLLVGSALSL